MMAIQWFPGHMHVAQKKVAETMAKVDMVIEIVDARMPLSSSNPMIERLRLHRQRPALRIINKADLADPKLSQVWLNYFREQQGSEALLMGEDNKQAAIKQIAVLCKKLAPFRNDAEKPLRAMILGIPNVGKSTLLNTLAKRKVAKVADTPGVTKSQQRIETLDGVILYDTPGLMWPKVEHEPSGFRLALGGSIGRNAYDEVVVAYFAIEELKARYPAELMARYKLANLDGEVEELFQLIGRKRGAVMSGGVIDEQKTADLIITDFRTKAIGRMTLETPDDFIGVNLGSGDEVPPEAPIEELE
jgi:ribosome biogenesis GTPase A